MLVLKYVVEMKLFKRNNTTKEDADKSDLARVALNAIHDGVVITDKNGIVQFINPAAITMTECGSANNAVGLDYGLIIKLESKEGRELNENENPLIVSMKNNQPLEPTQVALIATQSAKRIPVSISVLSAEGASQNRIITFRNIVKELEEEGEQTEFISTASHEMRTPVATIDGYLSLAINPQTATIDERARGYLVAAQKASKHLGQLFQNLLDVTKLDDGRIRPHFEPVEMTELVSGIAKDYEMRAKEAKISFSLGSEASSDMGAGRRISQVVYSFVDVNFVREILDNLIENAIKYTPAGGSIYVNVRGDGDRVLINVTDTGIGISAEDLAHIFQKFYRVDNSDTRTIGGTGLGLYLVKQRTEAMGGKVWAESAFGEGSTFYVSLPRITKEEYNKRMIVVENQKMMQPPAAPSASPASPAAPATAPVAPSVAPAPTTPPVASTPVTPAAPAPTSPAAPSQPPTPSVPPTPPGTPPAPPAPLLTPPAPQTATANQTYQSQSQINNNLNGGIK